MSSDEDESESLNVRPSSATCAIEPYMYEPMAAGRRRDELPWYNPTRIIHSFLNVHLSEILKTNFLILYRYFYSQICNNVAFFIGKLKLGPSWRHQHVVFLLVLIKCVKWDLKLSFFMSEHNFFLMTLIGITLQMHIWV